MRSHVSTHLEFSVVLIEAVLLLGFAIPLWGKRVNQFPPGKEALLVHVVAQQFSFNYHLPGADGQFARRDVNLVSNSNPLGIDPNDPAGKDDIVTTGELHVPLDRPVIAELSSKDVIHDFFLPDMVKSAAITTQRSRKGSRNCLRTQIICCASNRNNINTGF